LTQTIFSFLLEAFKFLHSVAIALTLPFSGFLYGINRYTQIPANTVWFEAILVISLGFLAFAGAHAISAVLALSVTALYVDYSTPIGARIVSRTSFKPGPFSLGIWGSKFFFLMLSVMEAPTT